MVDLNTSQLKRRINQIHKPASSLQGGCVLYVMSRDQRTLDNHALLAAQKHALAKKLPLAVVFCLRKNKNFRALEHYEWMLAGLREQEQSLKKLNIPLIMLVGDPEQRLLGCFSHLKPDAVYFDMSPLRGSRKLLEKLKNNVDCPLFVVDTHNIVPVWLASDKQEVAARTLRPKIHRLLAEFLSEPDDLVAHPQNWPGTVMSINSLGAKITEITSSLSSNGQVDLVQRFIPGEVAAHRALKHFIDHKLAAYAESRNDPSRDGLSELSPYLHYGQLSSLRVVLEVMAACESDSSLQPSADVLIEEMVVRKELSDNFCYYNQQYDSLEAAPQWAQSTLQKHALDKREYVYGLQDFMQAKTHDPAWNAAQLQMVKTGKMHGYMRMYWAKKVLEWSESPEEALKTLIYLNDLYSIDGGDPNGYVGILWSVAGLHDRPWGERAVYGTVRCMVYTGLKRKFNIEKYITANT